ncbi:MAG: NAD(P)-dependent oxidoreductase [Actinobacteria bacterium]|nr:NAD(P)-dependent oxidoreductase [Actinomycetota bacterium]
MKVVVTGGSGLIGTYVVDELVNYKYEVLNFDIVEPKENKSEFVKGDMLNIEDCRKYLKGADVIVHLAAIPNPFNDPPERIIYYNVMGTANMFIAAAELGINKVIHCSTDSTYGFWFRKQEFLPYYLPLDEEHPINTQDSYGFSKKIDEEIAANFARSHSIYSMSIRIPFIAIPNFIMPHMIFHKISSYKEMNENPLHLKSGFWSYCHVRDVAQAFRLAVDAITTRSVRKHEIFCVCADDNITKSDSIDLVKKYWSEMILFKKEIKGRQSLYDNSKAKIMLGYKPNYSWRDFI